MKRIYARRGLSLDNTSGFPPIAAFSHDDDSPLGSDFKRYDADAFTRSVHPRSTMHSVYYRCIAGKGVFFQSRYI